MQIKRYFPKKAMPEKINSKGVSILLVGWVWVLVFVFLLAFWSQPTTAASFQVSPIRFEFSLKKRFTNFFTLTNNSDESIRIRVFPRFVEFDPENKITEKVGHDYDLSRWMVFNPRLLTVRPKQKRVIRFSVRPPKSLAEGEYRTVVFFEEMPGQPGKVQKKSENEPMALKINLLTRLGVTLYGMSGEEKKEVTFEKEGLTVEKKHLKYSAFFENTGNIHLLVDLQAQLMVLGGDVLDEFKGPFMLQRGQRKHWVFESDKLIDGILALKIKATSKDLEIVDISVPIIIGAVGTD